MSTRKLILISLQTNWQKKIEQVLKENSVQLQNNIERAIGEIEDAVADAVEDALSTIMPSALAECLSSFDFVLPNGTVAKPRRRMRLLSPDKTKMVICYGGVRVDDLGKCNNNFKQGDKRWALVVQTRFSSWDHIVKYQEKEDAVTALMKIKAAMDEGKEAYKLE